VEVAVADAQRQVTPQLGFPRKFNRTSVECSVLVAVAGQTLAWVATAVFLMVARLVVVSPTVAVAAQAVAAQAVAASMPMAQPAVAVVEIHFIFRLTQPPL
jgi:hypothetical protein